MSKLQKLIQELCPDGVEYKTLGEIATIKNGRDYKHLGKGNVPVYGSGGIMTYVDTYVYNKPTVLIPRKGSLGNLFYVDTPFWNVDTIFYTEVDTQQIDVKYLYYLLAKEHLENLNKAGGVPSLTQSILNKIILPIPPLEVQNEIVRILDHFTDLAAEMQAELQARKEQYEYYRNQLLTFNKIGGGTQNVTWMKMSEICEIGTGSSNTQDELSFGLYPFFVRSQTVRRKNEYEFDETAIITSGDGVGVGKIFHYIEGKYALHQRAYRIHVIQKMLIPRYLFYYMRCNFYNYITHNAYTSSVTSIRKPMLLNFPIPIPSLEEQERIITILDKFDSLTSDLSQGLPAEIAAVQEQYEYYRNKILSFPRIKIGA